MFELTEKVTLLSGCGKTHGMGCGIAKVMAKQGSHIAIADLGIYPDEPNPYPDYPEGHPATWAQMAETVKAIKAEAAPGVEVERFKFDVRYEEQVERMVGEVLARFGKIDCLVNLSGLIIGLTDFVDSPMDAYDITVDVMCRGYVLTAKHVCRHMKERGQGGVIINISSIGGRNQWPHILGYALSKTANLGLTNIIGQEMGIHGIRAVTVCPNSIPQTDVCHSCFETFSKREGITVEEFEARDLKRFWWCPPGTYKPRFTRPSDVGYLCAFLASDEAEHITNTHINVDGGSCMR